MKMRNGVRDRQNGFSLLEMLFVVLLLGIISAGIFDQMDLAQQRAASEQVRLDNFQEARDFVDQFFRDINQIGYPNSRMVDAASYSPALVTQTTFAWASPYINDNRLAVGLVKIDSKEIRFEGDMKGDGVVQGIGYEVNGSGSCPLCLQRSQVDKITGDPRPAPTGAQVESWGSEINDVVLSTDSPIFTYFKADGTQVPAASLPLNISTAAGAQTIASIKTIQISLTIRNANVKDLKTGLAIETTFEGVVSLNNCSMAVTAGSGAPMACN